jgi:asparagine synthetase B (glutamine-hydrolysing)
MVSEDGRYVLVYNGEVFNYIELREKLIAAGRRFRTKGDTEVVLSSLAHWGPDAFTRFNGMWALALLDTVRGELTVSRDRFGIKPLYVFIHGRTLLISSEIKGILEVAPHKFRVSPEAANAYLLQDLLCSSTQTFFEGIEEFPPGHYAKVNLDYSPSKAFDLISEASWFNDEPIGSFSTVAHYLIMHHASKIGVTVLLSGQGADELLWGYRKYLGFYIQELCAAGRFAAAAQVLGGFLRRGTLLPGISYQEGKRYLPGWLRIRDDDIRGPLLRENGVQHSVGLNGGGVVGRAVADIERLSVPALVHYEDRMSMSAGEEIRLPFLDYRLVGLLAPAPAENKLRDGWTKWIFRKAMEPLLPPAITWRKDKQYFKVPQEQWLKYQLREDVSALLKTEWASESLGLIDKNRFGVRYDKYLKQRSMNSRLGIKDIFSPIALELWTRRFATYLCSCIAMAFLLPSLVQY